MSLLRIETKGEVCLPFVPGIDPGLRYDIPRDCLGFPVLPFSTLPDSLNPLSMLPGLGFGVLKSLDALIFAVEGLALSRQVFPNFVTDRFTAIRMVQGKPCRVLNAGLTFVCSVDVPDDAVPAVERQLAAMTRIGITDESVSGEVRMSLAREERRKTAVSPLPRRELAYRRLHYSVRLITPLCSYRPYDRQDKGDDFIPGAVMRNWIRERLGGRFRSFAAGGELRCSNAYLSVAGRRSIPPSSCMAQRRAEKSVVDYRLASSYGRMPVVISKPLGGYMSDFSSSTFACDKPKMKVSFLRQPEEPERSGWGNRRLMLREHQLFRGFFEGTDEQVRTIAELIASDGFVRLGDYTDEGFGESVIRTVSFDTDDGRPAAYQREFDVVLLSDAIFHNRFGCPDASRESFMAAVEDALDARGKLAYVSGGVTSGVWHDVDMKTGAQRSWSRVVSSGCALRLRVRDGETVDISALNGGFIGDRNGEGFGEVLVLPAYDNVHRYIRAAAPERIVAQEELTNSQMLSGATFAGDVTKDTIRYGVSLLAANDAKDGGVVDDEILRSVLDGVKSGFDETVSFEDMKEWYLKALAANRSADENAEDVQS